MSAEYADVPALLRALFASLLDAEPWSAFLEQLAQAAGADWTTLILTLRSADRPGMILTPRGDPAVGQDYLERLFAVDPFTGLPEGEVTHFRDFVPPERRRPGQDYEDWLVQTSSDEVLGLDLCESEGLELRLRLTRAAGRPRFTGDDAQRLQQIVPHLRVALRLFDRLEADRTERQIYAEAVSKMAVGLVILDRHGKVIRLNARAETILGEADGVALREGGLWLADPAQNRAFRDFAARGPKADTMTFRVPRPSGEGAVVLVVAGAQAADYVVASGGPATVVFLNDPVQTPEISAEALGSLLGLTPAEAAVAASLATGLTLSEVAERHGISPNTVRAHLRSVFTKTGVNRQSQLVHLVHHALPGLARRGR
jgi:DNA-binding CsgD family transcriptional regulator